MIITYGIKDLQRILNIVNPSFGAVREEGFDFREIMPKAYSDGADLLKYHYIASDGDVDVATAGNIPMQINVGKSSYQCSFLGSVATLPKYEGKGYMRTLMQNIEQDDIAFGKDFSLLTGARGRYARYGYTKVYSGYSFTFGEYYFKHTPKNQDITIREYNGEIDALYNIYTATQPLLLRIKDDILQCLEMSRSKVRLIEHKGNIVGYYAFCTRKKVYLPEFAITDYSLAPSVMREIFDFEKVASFSVWVNPLDTKLAGVLDAVCEDACLQDELQIRVYNLCAFIKMLVELNVEKGIISGENATDSVVVDGNRYDISIENSLVCVDCNRVDEQGLSVNEFLRSAINKPLTCLKKTKGIFPLAFGISLPDCF